MTEYQDHTFSSLKQHKSYSSYKPKVIIMNYLLKYSQNLKEITSWNFNELRLWIISQILHTVRTFIFWNLHNSCVRFLTPGEQELEVENCHRDKDGTDYEHQLVFSQ